MKTIEKKEKYIENNKKVTLMLKRSNIYEVVKLIIKKVGSNTIELEKTIKTKDSIIAEQYFKALKAIYFKA